MRAILKMGGSVLTDKTKADSARENEIKRIAKEISNAVLNDPQLNLILILGAGCYGHIPAKKWNLKAGALTREQIERGVPETHKGIAKFAEKVSQALQHENLTARYIPTIEVAKQENGKLIKIEKETIQNAIDRKEIPMLTGDLAPDSKLNYSICSGDAIVPYLAREFSCDIIAFGSDVDGIFTADPKKRPEAELVEEINEENLNEMLKKTSAASTIDVTGGMKNKLEEVAQIARKTGKEIIIFNAATPKNVEHLLSGKKMICTRIRLKK